MTHEGFLASVHRLRHVIASRPDVATSLALGRWLWLPHEGTLHAARSNAAAQLQARRSIQAIADRAVSEIASLGPAAHLPEALLPQWASAASDAVHAIAIVEFALDVPTDQFDELARPLRALT